MYVKRWVSLMLVCLFTTIVFSESFVKEKMRKSKKVSLSHCQESALGSLACLIEQSGQAALIGSDLVQVSQEISSAGNQFIAHALLIQKQAIEATKDLLDEDRNGGSFTSMTIEELDAYCKKVEKLINSLDLLQEVLVEKLHIYHSQSDALKNRSSQFFKETLS